MQLKTANRKNVKIKMAIQGPSGGGKTYGAFLIAFGLCNDWSKIAVLDTENHSSELYAHLGGYQVLYLEQPFTPERYIEALKVCEQSGIEVVIIDSISHEWFGAGGMLEQHSKMVGNSYTNWSKLTPRHNALIHYLLQSKLHVINTIRAKQEYVLTEKNGKQVPEKVGLKGITKEGLDYECTIVFEVDIKNMCHCSKDRTSLFINKPEFQITSEVGKQILEWCNQGEHVDDEQRINDCKSISELLELYELNPSLQDTHKEVFSRRKKELSKPSKSTSHAVS